MEQSVPKHRHRKLRHRGIAQKNKYNIHKMAKVWNQEYYICHNGIYSNSEAFECIYSREMLLSIFWLNWGLDMYWEKYCLLMRHLVVLYQLYNAMCYHFLLI